MNLRDTILGPKFDNIPVYIAGVAVLISVAALVLAIVLL